MALIYITGAPGAGKTTLQQELSRRGYKTYDLDNPRFGGPHNKASGDRVVIPPANQRPPEWFNEHEWRVYHDGFTSLKEEARDEDIILCGVAAADDEVLYVFDKIIYLNIDEQTLSDRLKNRHGNDYGKNDFELKEILERKRGLDDKYAALSVIHIDASKSLDETVEQITANIS